ncbi:MAG TPA: hypothetical protein VFS17_09475 [Methylophilaceae bacterium]|nr:hypothetical protein [Methylophilaceae bacterium]
MAALPAIAATDAVDATKTVPSPGQWSTVVAILDNSDNHYLLKTNVANDPAGCMDALDKIAEKVQETGGAVWTTPDKKNLSYEKESSPPNYAYTRAKVLELRCVREPFEGELVSK